MWIKANPNLGVSLSADYLADQVKDAKNRPEAVRNVMTKNVDLWSMPNGHGSSTTFGKSASVRPLPST